MPLPLTIVAEVNKCNLPKLSKLRRTLLDVFLSCQRKVHWKVHSVDGTSW